MKGPAFIIYGLVDPRTLLIRYVGMSSSGLLRPKQHRKQSGPHCGRWIKQLQRLGLDYEIVVLEVRQSAFDLPAAECWWIDYGKASRWPLTNCRPGGLLSKAGAQQLRERLERRAARAKREDEEKKMRAKRSEEQRALWFENHRKRVEELRREHNKRLEESRRAEEPAKRAEELRRIQAPAKWAEEVHRMLWETK
jgi:hypothetical protein